MKTNVQVSGVDMKERAELGIRAGDTVRVWNKIKETDNKGKERTRLQAFEGLVLACKHGSEAGGTFTVRKVSGSIGVERIFPLYSPMIDKIEIVKRAKVRRAKLYLLRDKVAKQVKRILRRTEMVSIATKGASELEEERKRAEEEQARIDAEQAQIVAEQEAKESADSEQSTVDGTDDNPTEEEPQPEEEETKKE